MSATPPRRWIAAVAATVTVAACAGSGSSGDDVLIAVDLQAGQAWTATGGAVEAGQLCPSGYRHLTAFLDAADHRPLTAGEFAQRIEEVTSADQPEDVVDYVLVYEYSCTDGSGAFTLVEDPGTDGRWEVQSGTGAHATLDGAGDVIIRTADTDAGPPTAVSAELSGTIGSDT